MSLMIVLIHNNERERLNYAHKMITKILVALPGSKFIEIYEPPKNLEMSILDYFYLLLSRFSLVLFRVNWHRKSIFNYGMRFVTIQNVFLILRDFLHYFVVSMKIVKIELTRKGYSAIRDLNLRHNRARALLLNSNAKYVLVLESDFIAVSEEKFIAFLRRITQLNHYSLVNLCNNFTLEEMGVWQITNNSNLMRLENVNCRAHYFPYVNTACALLLSRDLCSEFSNTDKSKILEYWSADWLYNKQLRDISPRHLVLDVCESLIINGSLNGFYASTIQPKG